MTTANDEFYYRPNNVKIRVNIYGQTSSTGFALQLSRRAGLSLSWKLIVLRYAIGVIDVKENETVSCLVSRLDRHQLAILRRKTYTSTETMGDGQIGI